MPNELDNSPLGVTLSEGGFALAAASAAEGAHTLTAEVADKAGNSSGTVSTSFLVDLTAPVVVTAQPQDLSASKNNQPTVIVALNDTLSGVDPESVFLRLEGELLATVAQADGLAVNAQAELDAPLADGFHQAEVSFTDRAGNPASHTWLFEIDTTPPPAPLLAEGESPIITDADSVVLKIRTLGDAEVLEVTASAGSVGTPVASTTNGSTDTLWTVLVDGLPEGDTAVRAIARDEATNQSAPLDIVIRVGVDEDPPIILEINPESGEEFDTEFITMYGTAVNHAFDRVEITVYRMDGAADGVGFEFSHATGEAGSVVGQGPGDLYTWEWSVDTVRLGRGLNRVEVIGIDESGNLSVTHEVFYTLNPIVPDLGADEELPLASKPVLLSYFPRDPQDVVGHSITAYVHINWEDPTYPEYAYEWDEPVIWDGGSKNLAWADFRYTLMMWGYGMYEDPYMSMTFHTGYRVTYLNPNGSTTTYEVHDEKFLPEGQGGATGPKCPAKLSVHYGEENRTATVVVDPAPGFSKKDFFALSARPISHEASTPSGAGTDLDSIIGPAPCGNQRALGRAL